jgi:hypothetical protein
MVAGLVFGYIFYKYKEKNIFENRVIRIFVFAKLSSSFFRNSVSCGGSSLVE